MLTDDLARVGVEVEDVWDLVNARGDYRPAIPVLIDWLAHLDDRLPAGRDRERLREGIVRALSVRPARPAAAPVLVAQFRSVDDPTGMGVRWAIGNALEVVGDDSVFDELAALARDRSYGRARQMLVLGLGRSRDPRAVPLLVELLDDEDVAAHAVMALGKAKAAAARPALEARLDDPRPLVRKEAAKALKKLPAAAP